MDTINYQLFLHQSQRNARRKRRNENKTVQDEKHKENKKILHEIINQNEIINNSVTADRNNKSKETQAESSANTEKGKPRVENT